MKEKDNYIILGDSEKAEEIKQLLMEKYGIGKGEVKTVFADEVSVKDLLKEVDFVPLFSKKKIIYIKNCEELSKEDCELLKKFFQSPLPDVCLILTGKEIKGALDEYVDIETVKDEETSALFPGIFRMRSPRDRKKVISLLKEYIKHNPLDFPTAINASFVYIRNIVKNQKKVDKTLLDAYQKLHRLDFELKTGRIDKKEIDIFVFTLLP
ncbi:MAG: hypothetical protein PHI44_05865 [Candidatus Ratteibacteria bacterium]|nr:hypothetical protein [Candidatus Ratteibacteria bacterium]